MRTNMIPSLEQKFTPCIILTGISTPNKRLDYLTRLYAKANTPQSDTPLGYSQFNTKNNANNKEGVSMNEATTPETETAPVAAESDKRILPAFILCFFLGIFGAHRFYAGKIGTGILHLITLGALGIGH